MAVLTLLVLVLTLWAIIASWAYFRKQKRKIQKYPFFKLRDDIIWAMVESDDPSQYQRTYTLVNASIGKLKHLDFSFFSAFVTELYSHYLENEYREAVGLDGQAYPEWEPSKYDLQFVKLMVSTARENSFLLRVGMTNFAYRFIFAPSIIRGIKKFLRKHPETLQKGRVVARYSYLNHKLAVAQ